VLDGATQPPGYPFDPWTYGTSTTGTACAAGKCFGTSMTSNYPQCQHGYLMSPPIDLTACAGQSVTLSFRHAYAFWKSGGSYDGGIVEVSSDGQSWSVPPGSYPGRVAPRHRSGTWMCKENTFRVDEEDGFIGKQATTSTFEVELPASLRSATTRIRFSFGSGLLVESSDIAESRAAADFGWRIDDVMLVAK
jgi:hypothetical protein